MCETAIAALRNRGFSVKTDDAGKAWYVFAGDLKLVPADVENLGALRGLRHLSLRTCAHDDSVWPLLANMPGLETLNLTAGFANKTKGPPDIEYPGLEDPPVWRWGVSDNGSEFLRFLPKLTSLDLSWTHIGDMTLEHIGRLDSLEKLDLLDTQITSAGLAQLRGLRHLKELCLIYTAVNDDGLATLSRLTGLTELWLEQTKISDGGLVHVGKLAALTALSVHNTAVTEQGLIHIRSLKHLKTLYVGTPITAVGVSYLKELTSLYVLYIGSSVGGRDMSESEVSFVRAELPNVIVEY
jgi:hypothetical protein